MAWDDGRHGQLNVGKSVHSAAHTARARQLLLHRCSCFLCVLRLERQQWNIAGGAALGDCRYSGRTCQTIIVRMPLNMDVQIFRLGLGLLQAVGILAGSVRPEGVWAVAVAALGQV